MVCNTNKAISTKSPSCPDRHGMQQEQGMWSSGERLWSSPLPPAAQCSNSPEPRPTPIKLECVEVTDAKPCTVRAHAKRPAINARAIPFGQGTNLSMHVMETPYAISSQLRKDDNKAKGCTRLQKRRTWTLPRAILKDLAPMNAVSHIALN
ncbi:hypothetical protein [Methylosinus sporium]|uniref:hypothetical protein n=1 Tax=Methylosinus sporium TaxID=428 RepID=UPI0011B2361B|nr:hypothetical protein [Methylosinus sporium]